MVELLCRATLPPTAPLPSIVPLSHLSSPTAAELAHTKPGGDAILVDGSTEKNGKTPSPGKAPEPLPIGTLGRRRTLLNVAVSVVFVGVMHGAHGLFPVALVCGAFAVGHALKGTRLAQPVAWVMAVLLIWLKEKWYGVFTFENLLGVGLRGLDGFRGMHPWRLSFNLAILRMVSFNLDLHWAELHLRRGDSGSPVGKQVGNGLV